MPGRQRQSPGWPNPRVAAAMGGEPPKATEQSAQEYDPLPPLPDPLTEDTFCEWLARTVPHVDADVNYKRRMMSIATWHEFRKRKEQG